MSPFLNGLATLNQILAAGISITAFSLWLYALTFNLRERVARAFAALLVFVTGVYFGDVVISTLSQSVQNSEPWLRLQWIGIAFVPVAYLHFSDALLATTGQPSRGRRRFSIRVLYVIALVFVVAAAITDTLVHGPVRVSPAGLLSLQIGFLFPVFTLYLVGCVAWAVWNFLRAYRRCLTSTARRRMLYLILSAAAPLVGSFPFLLLLGPTADLHPILAWTMTVAVNVAVSGLLVVMAYTVAYFGVVQPDRIVKGRFFQWILRGPVVASTTLAVYVLVNRYGPLLPVYDPRLLPFLLIAVLIVLQFVITLVRLPIERRLFYGAGRDELSLLQTLETRLLTTRDLQQFLELVLVSVCDVLRRPAAFIVALGDEGKIAEQVNVGDDPMFDTLGTAELPSLGALHRLPMASALEVYEWGEYWIAPLRSTTNETLGLLGLKTRLDGISSLNEDEQAALTQLLTRAAAALEDRRLQQDVFAALGRLLPQIETVQRLRAAAAYSGARALAAPDATSTAEWNESDLPQIIREALNHYWGGPKLTNSPLLKLRVVEQALAEHDGNAVNALRAVLQTAIERLKPEGQRKFTSDWLLYNILEMKFLQERRVREVAMRLAVSEAELYRKQRIALEEVAAAIRAMEREVQATH